jgi:hypothetical protein
MRKRILIGLVHVKPVAGANPLKGAAGAFVNVLAMASDKRDYSRSVKRELASYELRLISIEGLEPLAKRMQRKRMRRKIVELSESLTPKRPVALDVFCCYEKK